MSSKVNSRITTANVTTTAINATDLCSVCFGMVEDTAKEKYHFFLSSSILTIIKNYDKCILVFYDFLLFYSIHKIPKLLDTTFHI